MTPQASRRINGFDPGNKLDRMARLKDWGRGPGAGRGLRKHLSGLGPIFCGMGTSTTLLAWSLSHGSPTSLDRPPCKNTPQSVCCFPGGPGLRTEDVPDTLAFKTL